MNVNGSENRTPLEETPRQGETWNRWLMQTAKTWADVSAVVKETGIEAIDYDHRRMTEAILEISNLLELVEDGGLRMEAIRQQEQVLENLYAYSARHFAREFQLIKKHDLPGYEEQRQAHNVFLKILVEMIKDFREGRLTASHNVRAVMLEWWIRHINEVDYNTFCSENWTAAIIRSATEWKDVEHLIRSTGVENLDDEHREMTSNMLKLIHDLDGNRDPAEMDALFGFLIDIAELHFDDEETFIEQYDLSGLAEQRQQHAIFLELLRRHRKEVMSGMSSVSDDMRFEIVNWWIEHINIVDYNSFSLDKHAASILAATGSWQDASEFIKKTDIPQINEDHREITLLIIGLDDVIADAASEVEGWRERAVLQFQTLNDACAEHFRREQAIMLETNFAGISQHNDQHEKFLRTWEKRAGDIAEGRAVPTDKTKHALLEWWVEHIREFDMKAFSGRFELQALDNVGSDPES